MYICVHTDCSSKCTAVGETDFSATTIYCGMSDDGFGPHDSPCNNCMDRPKRATMFRRGVGGTAWYGGGGYDF